MRKLMLYLNQFLGWATSRREPVPGEDAAREAENHLTRMERATHRVNREVLLLRDELRQELDVTAKASAK